MPPPGPWWMGIRQSALNGVGMHGVYRLGEEDFRAGRLHMLGFHGGSDGKESPCDEGDPGSIPGSGRSPEEGNGNPLQYSCLGNSVDGEAWWATVHGVSKSRTRLSYYTDCTYRGSNHLCVELPYPGGRMGLAQVLAHRRLHARHPQALTSVWKRRPFKERPQISSLDRKTITEEES